jgi:hypothetical protein
MDSIAVVSHYRFNNSGSLAILLAMRRASSVVSTLGKERRYRFGKLAGHIR